jgi:MFS family permease
MDPSSPDPVPPSFSGRFRAWLPSPRPLQAVLTVADVKAIAGASLVARLPRGMASLAVVLLVHASTGSYAAAGAAAGAMAIGDAVVSPVQGRLIDRLDQRRVLLPSGTMYLLVLLGLAGAADAHCPAALLIAMAAVGGMAYPPISASMKTLWPLLVGGGPLLQTAYAVESLIQQALFFVGPLLVSALVVVGSPTIAVIATGVFGFVGTVGFVASPASRAWRSGRRDRSLTGVLGDRAVCLVVAVTLTQSVVFGALYVAVPAFAARHGSANAAGALLAVMNVGAIVGGLVGASRPIPRGVVAHYLHLSLLLTGGVAPLVLARSPETMGLLLIVAGLFVAPTAAASYVLIDLISTSGHRTEAFTWMSTAVAAGGAVGSAISGVLIDYASIRLTLLFAVLSCAVGAAAVLAGRDLLGRHLVP